MVDTDIPTMAFGAPFAHEPRLLTDMLDATVNRHGARPAIDFMGRVTRYADLARSIDRATAGLQALGVTNGTRVALCLPNTPYYPILFFAVLKAGGIVVNVNPLYVERELRHLLVDSGAQIVATCDIPDIHARVLSVAAELGVAQVITCPMADVLPPLKSIAYRLFRRRDIAATPPASPRHLTFARLLAAVGAPVAPAVAVTPSDVAVLQYTGGTTGLPKAAMLTHDNLVSNADANLAHTGGVDTGTDRILGVLPLFHVFALTTVLGAAVRIGAMMILMPRFDLHQALDTIARTKPTYFPAVPTIFGAIAKLAETQTINLSGIKTCISGGAALPAEVRQSFETLTGATLVEGYGLSEASPIITCNPIGGLNKPGSAGIPFPGTTIEIRDRDDSSRLLPRGENGEICVRGPQVMKGYWNQPAETQNVFIDGALRTGDVGHLDADGYLFIVDRIKDLILCGGYNVYPRVIEEALYEHPAVVEAVVIGIPDSYRGQSPKAFVTLNAPGAATPTELRDFLRDKVSKIELPREVEIRDSLPKTLIGKLSKKELVEEERARAAT